MIAVYFFYGLAFFSLGLAVYFESRLTSEIPLRKHLPWLGAFGLVHGSVEWLDMFLLIDNFSLLAQEILIVIRMILLPLSALLLVRFGIGLIDEAGPLPDWLTFVPLVLLVPIALLVAYAVIVTVLASPLQTATDIWSRYLLYLPGNLLSAFGFIRQWRGLRRTGLQEAGSLMLGAALAFLFNALAAGLIVPTAPYGLAPWLNYDLVQALTGITVHVWRILTAITVMVLVTRALNVFETERKQQLAALQDERERALDTLRESEERFRTIFELAPFGMDIVDGNGRPLQANHALQNMLGYTGDELRQMVFTDYTHPDDVAESQRLVQEVLAGKRDNFQLEKRYYHKDGALVWGRVTVSGVRDPDGTFRYFIAMVEDVTRRKQTEAALQIEREQAQAEKLRVQIEARQAAEEWVSSLVDISRQIADMEDVDQVLLDIAQKVKTLLKTDIVSIGLIDETGSYLKLKCQVTISKSYIPSTPVLIENKLLWNMLQSGQSYRFPEDVATAQANWYGPTIAREIKAAAIVPLTFDGYPVGGLWACRYTPDSFTETDLINLESLADQAVIALQHASLTARLQSVAALEERSRIAREMHDGLAQILGYLSLQMQTLEALSRQGNQEKLLAELKQTRVNIKQAQADVRENILSLRTTLAGESGLIPALREYVTEFSLQAGTETTFVNELKETPSLSPLVEVQLVRIIQEALANVRKHAQAGSVEVRLAAGNGRLLVTITDDGVGFASGNGRHHFGLQTMQERAESVKGCLTVQSVLGKGTQVELWLPLLSNRSVSRHRAAQR